MSLPNDGNYKFASKIRLGGGSVQRESHFSLASLLFLTSLATAPLLASVVDQCIHRAPQKRTDFASEESTVPSNTAFSIATVFEDGDGWAHAK